jgi:Holliday junction resolvasome RuvABC endonuclease subunit
MLLALDVSTSITGISVIDREGHVIYCSAVDLRKYKNFFTKCEVMRAALMDIRTDYAISEVYIEQPFMFFNSGGSSAKTMAALQRFNGVVSWLCHATIGITPEYITAGQARKEVNLKIPRGQKAKPVVLQFVLDNDPTFSVQYTRYGNPTPDSYDKADSWVIAKAGWSVWKKSQSYAES